MNQCIFKNCAVKQASLVCCEKLFASTISCISQWSDRTW